MSNQNNEQPMMNSFVKTIQEKIFSGQLSIGDKLPSERNLASEYQCSKTMIHDGLLQLVNQGFLNAIPRKGYFVANYTQHGNVDVLNAYLAYNSNHLDSYTFDALIEAILAIEGSALVKLSTNANENDLHYLKSIVKKMKIVDESNVDEIVSLFSLFHHSVCYLCKNALFPLLFNSFNELLEVFYKDFIQEYGKENCLKAMRYFIGYIETKQGQKAYNLLGNLLKQFRSANKKHNGANV